MKRLLVICAIGLASCSSNSDRKSETSKKAVEDDTNNATANYMPEQNKTYCFLRVEGTDNQDTTTVNFTVNTDKVKGELKWLPKEKDSRQGTLTGTISGNEIRAVWSYMQEGVKDSITLAFKLSAQQLMQKPLKIDKATGRQVTDEVADYSLMYSAYLCEQ